MMMVLMLLGILAALELGLFALPATNMVRILAAFVAVGVLLSSLWLVVVTWSNVWAVAVAFLSIYRVINMLRLSAKRMHALRLRQTGLRASAWLIAVQILVIAGWLQSAYLVSAINWWLVLAGLQLLFAGVLLWSTIRHVMTTHAPKELHNGIADHDLPTLTVAIPARNETEDLEACLSALVASDYPKLEILVLDDCSQLKRTPEIIRSYAHAGVRFLQGEVPPETWLAKNYAYQQLFEAASGELILFCGVDVRVQPRTLRLLVAALLAKHKDMISVLPRNLVPNWQLFQATTLIQSMRYAWELALPRRYFSRPPVLSTCWLIRRSVLTVAGGLTEVAHTIMPESHFAKLLLRSDGYAFMRSSESMDLTSNKSLHEQHTTAVRVEYPRLHRRVELVAVVSAVQLVGVVGPYVLLIWSILGLLPSSLIVPCAVTVTLLTLGYSLVVALTYRQWLTRSLWVLPVAAILDVILLHESMLRYEFSDVIWKDRNVCIPVMRAQPGAQLQPLSGLPRAS